MSTRNWKLRIEDILDAIAAIENYVDGIDAAAWEQDRKTIDAVIRNLEIIGEAAGKVPIDIQERYADIPWHKMKGTRNLLAHEYFGVDSDVIWQTVKEDLPVLKALLSRICE